MLDGTAATNKRLAESPLKGAFLPINGNRFDEPIDQRVGSGESRHPELREAREQRCRRLGVVHHVERRIGATAARFGHNSITVLTAAVAVVAAPVIGSIVSGLFVLTDQSYEVGDMVRIIDTADDTTGFIEDITLRYTKIFTLDNTFPVIPNGTIRDRDVINYSAEDSRTRLSLDILVTYEGDLDAARDLIERAARDVDVVIRGGPDIRIGSARYPAAPTCYINEYADSGVLLTLRYWMREPYKLLTVRSAVQENVWERLDGAHVEFAYPHTQVVFDDQDDPSTPDDDSRFDDRQR